MYEQDRSPRGLCAGDALLPQEEAHVAFSCPVFLTGDFRGGFRLIHERLVGEIRRGESGV